MGHHYMLLGTGRMIHKDYKAYTIFFIRLIRRGCSSYEGLRSTANFPRGFDCYSSSKVFDLRYVERVLGAYHLNYIWQRRRYVFKSGGLIFLSISFSVTNVQVYSF